MADGYIETTNNEIVWYGQLEPALIEQSAACNIVACIPRLDDPSYAAILGSPDSNPRAVNATLEGTAGAVAAATPATESNATLVARDPAERLCSHCDIVLMILIAAAVVLAVR